MFEVLESMYGPFASSMGVDLPLAIGIVAAVSLWDVVWKFLGMWRAAKNNSVPWFICLGIFNTVGILPILYLYVFSKNKSKRKK
ncbi:hypothetical protein JXB27_03640 [Candidatus Woesearchaeota archaeon]|nr:hypothetical protein [Candidatus Woesearchaeota archaeon]